MRTYLSIGLLFFALLAGAADFIGMKLDFTGADWRDVLTIRGEVAVQEGALVLSPGASVSTQRFPLEDGELRVNGISSGALLLRVHFVRGGNYSNPGADVASADIPILQAGPFSAAPSRPEAAKSGDGFRLEIVNPGKRGASLNTLELKSVLKGIRINGDPLFGNAQLNRDHWMTLHGKDWDQLGLGTDPKSIRVIRAAGPGGGNLLAITDTGTVRTPQFPYGGERLLIGAWVKQEDIRKGPDMPSWACAGIQVVQYDKNGKSIGHADMIPLREGSSAWRFYTMTVLPGQWSRGTSSFALLPRVFHGATGTLKVTAVSVIRQDGSGDPRPYDAKTGRISVEVNRPGALFTPVWQCADMSHLCDINQPVMRQALAETRKAGVRHLRLREFMQGGLLKKLDPDGSFELDFTVLDKQLDYVVRELGFTPTITVETTPNRLSRKPKSTDHVFANIYPPRDLAVWKRIVGAVVLHWIDRYGRDAVAEWTFECWNEPNAPCFFAGTEAEFADIFGAYLTALSDIRKETGVRFGISTMSAADPSPWFYSCFDRAVSLERLDEIDSISFHIYAGFLRAMDYYAISIDRMRKIASDYPRMEKLPLYLTEYNANSMNDAKLNTAAAAAFNVKAIRMFLDKGVARAYYFSVCDYLWAPNKKSHFDGAFGYFTKTGIPKPVFNSLLLLNRFDGCRRLPLRSGNDPFDGIAGIAEDGTVKILISTFDECQPAATGPVRLKLALDWEGRPERVEAMMMRVDSSRGNSYSLYLRENSPDRVSQPDIASFADANRMRPENADNFHVVNGKLVAGLEIELNSLCYLEIAGLRTQKTTGR